MLESSPITTSDSAFQEDLRVPALANKPLLKDYLEECLSDKAFAPTDSFVRLAYWCEFYRDSGNVRGDRL